jgi:hypothetical protein
LRKRFDAVYALSVPELKDFLETTTIGDPWNYVVGRILEYRKVSASVGPGDGGHLDEDGINMKKVYFQRLKECYKMYFDEVSKNCAGAGEPETGDGAGASKGADEHWMRIADLDWCKRRFAKLAELDADHFFEQIAKQDGEVVQFFIDESLEDRPPISMRVRAVKKGIDARTFSPLRERFDILYDLGTPALEGFAKTTLSPDPWGKIARDILVYRVAPGNDAIEMKEALFMTVEGYCKDDDKRFEALVGGGGAGAGAGSSIQSKEDEQDGDNAPSIFVQTETQTEAFAKLAEEDTKTD